MPLLRLRPLYATIVLVGACGSDPEPSSTTHPEDASMDASSPRDAASDRSTSADAPTTRDATAAEVSASTMDGSDGTSAVLDGQGDPLDGASGDGDTRGDATSNDGSGLANPDGAADGAAMVDAASDAAASTDGAIDAGGDVILTPDATSADVADVSIDAAGDGPSAADATSDQLNESCVSDACPPSGFPGSALVDAGQGAMINGWIGTPAQLWKLCYSTALHVRSGTTFHASCDFKGPSISIAKVSFSGATRIIGGYNSGSWFSPATSTFSNNSASFLFSVTNAFKHAYPGSMPGPFYILNNANYGPTFGAGADWYVHSQMTMGTCRPGYTYQCRVGALDSAECNTDFCGTPSESDYYVLEDLEVWIH